jgi:hypothetical protein
VRLLADRERDRRRVAAQHLDEDQPAHPSEPDALDNAPAAERVRSWRWPLIARLSAAPSRAVPCTPPSHGGGHA